MRRYRTRPIVVAAERFDGTIESAMSICGPGGTPDLYYGNPAPGNWDLCIFVVTKGGRMQADPGDWIITGVAQERYPVKDEIFRMTYEPAGEAS